VQVAQVEYLRRWKPAPTVGYDGVPARGGPGELPGRPDRLFEPPSRFLEPGLYLSSPSLQACRGVPWAGG